MEGVRGSIPLSSTKYQSSGLERWPVDFGTVTVGNLDSPLLHETRHPVRDWNPFDPSDVVGLGVQLVSSQ